MFIVVCLFSLFCFWQGIENGIPFGVVATIAEILQRS
jgi:hypothetical protein